MLKKFVATGLIVSALAITPVIAQAGTMMHKKMHHHHMMMHHHHMMMHRHHMMMRHHHHMMRHHHHHHV